MTENEPIYICTEKRAVNCLEAMEGIDKPFAYQASVLRLLAAAHMVLYVATPDNLTELGRACHATREEAGGFDLLTRRASMRKEQQDD